MESFVLRAIKSLVLSAIMYFSLVQFGFSSGQALVISLIPLLLGMVGVMQELAFGLAGLAFIIAVFASVFVPDKSVSALEFVKETASSIMQNAKEDKGIK